MHSIPQTELCSLSGALKREWRFDEKRARSEGSETWRTGLTGQSGRSGTLGLWTESAALVISEDITHQGRTTGCFSLSLGVGEAWHSLCYCRERNLVAWQPDILREVDQRGTWPQADTRDSESGRVESKGGQATRTSADRHVSPSHKKHQGQGPADFQGKRKPSPEAAHLVAIPSIKLGPGPR